VTIVKEKTSISENEQALINSIPWEAYILPQSNSIWENYGIENFSQFVLIDAAGYIVASPALGPTPNGQYETIDKTFYYLKKKINRQD